MAPASQHSVDACSETGLVDRDHVLRLGLPLGVLHRGGGVTVARRASIADDPALSKEGHGCNPCSAH